MLWNLVNLLRQLCKKRCGCSNVSAVHKHVCHASKRNNLAVAFVRSPPPPLRHRAHMRPRHAVESCESPASAVQKEVRLQQRECSA